MRTTIEYAGIPATVENGAWTSPAPWLAESLRGLLPTDTYDPDPDYGLAAEAVRVLGAKITDYAGPPPPGCIVASAPHSEADHA